MFGHALLRYACFAIICYELPAALPLVFQMLRPMFCPMLRQMLCTMLCQQLCYAMQSKRSYRFTCFGRALSIHRRGLVTRKRAAEVKHRSASCLLACPLSARFSSPKSQVRQPKTPCKTPCPRRFATVPTRPCRRRDLHELLELQPRLRRRRALVHAPLGPTTGGRVRGHRAEALAVAPCTQALGLLGAWGSASQYSSLPT